MEVSIEGYLLTQMTGSICLLTALSMILMGQAPEGRRLLLVAGVGSICSLLCTVTPMARGLGMVVMGLAVPVCALPRMPLRHRLRACGLHLLLSVLLVGAARVLHAAGLPATAAVWLATPCLLLTPRLRHSTSPLPVTRVEVTRQGRTLTLSAMLDSGNLVRDAVTGLPVIVCSRRALCRLIPQAVPGMLPEGFRLLSVRTATGTALMPIFRPDRVRLRGNDGYVEVQALLGVAVSGYTGFQALVPATLAEVPPWPQAHQRDELSSTKEEGT